jgi:hypothetical protein
MILSFAKPKKVKSTEEWKSNQADSAPPGTYVSNMSQDDKLRWKAKLTGTRSGNHRIEIRSEKPGVNLLVVVSGAVPNEEPHPYPYQRKRGEMWSPPSYQVKMSSNGTAEFDPTAWEELTKAVQEAREILAYLDDPEETFKGVVLRLIREGENPLDHAMSGVPRSELLRERTI